MDDSKSDNTDDLLTSIEPLIRQSEYFVNQKEYKNCKWDNSQLMNGFHSNVPIVVDDILSARSFRGEICRDRTTFQSPSLANIASHNLRQSAKVCESDRTVSSHLYEASISAQTTPRNMGLNRQSLYVADECSLSLKPTQGEDNESRLHADLQDAQTAWDHSRTEVQRLQLNNKQLSTQLHEAKLSIQTLSIQLEQVQLESKHKENTLSNLDNTLGKLVSGWKKRESQKEQDLDLLKQQLEMKDKVVEECERITEESRKALSNADKVVQMEKNRTEQFLKNVRIEIQNLKTEKTMLTKSNLELTTLYTNMEAEIKKLNGVCSDKNKTIEILNQQVKENYSLWKRENDNLKKDLDRLKEEGLAREFEIQCREDKFGQMKTEVNMLEEELCRCRKERDEKINALIEVKGVAKKMQDEHGVNLRKQEQEYRSKSQQDLTKTLAGIQDQHKRVVQVQHNNFQAKLNEQSKRHKMELERLRHVAEQEIASRLSDCQETIAMLRERLERAEKSVQFWQQEKEVVEKARNQISSKLYDLMNAGYCDGGLMRGLAAGSLTLSAQTSGRVAELVKPSFVPPKNQSLQQTVPQSFFEPIRSESTAAPQLSTAAFSSGNQPRFYEQNQAVLSSSATSLYY